MLYDAYNDFYSSYKRLRLIGDIAVTKVFASPFIRKIKMRSALKVSLRLC